VSWRCPECRSTALDVSVETWARLFQRCGDFETDFDDALDHSHEWDDDSPMKCRDCGHGALTEEFKVRESSAVCPNCHQPLPVEKFMRQDRE